MASSINRVFILGNLGADPEISHLPNGQPVTKFRVATNESWIGQDGSRVTHTDWHRIVVYGKQAEACHQYLRKGRTVFVEGRLRNRSWEDKDGQRRFVTEIVAQNVQFMGGGAFRETTANGAVPAETGPASATSLEDVPPTVDDDVPF